jgi:hypothetical protein
MMSGDSGLSLLDVVVDSMDVVALETVDVILYIVDLLTIHHHLHIKARPLFLGLVDYQ